MKENEDQSGLIHFFLVFLLIVFHLVHNLST